MRAKFQCMATTTTDYGIVNYQPSVEVKLQAVYGGSTNTEDNEFSSATPSGTITMVISNPAAQGFLKPGKKYYVDFTQAPE